MAREPILYNFDDCEVVTMSGRTRKVDAGTWPVYEHDVVLVFIGNEEVRLPPPAFSRLVREGVARRPA